MITSTAHRHERERCPPASLRRLSAHRCLPDLACGFSSTVADDPVDGLGYRSRTRHAVPAALFGLIGDRSLDLCGVNVVLEEGDRQSVYQAYNDAQLEGVGAVMVALRQAGIRDDAALRAMSADDQRNTLIVELDAQTKRGQALQGLSNLELVQTLLGVEPVH